uniref:Uncharacterized protein n=1 Tax=Paramormyrops kingsleyae TaxID=1676925 RepID=A0A3B3RHI6_9TELE
SILGNPVSQRQPAPPLPSDPVYDYPEPQREKRVCPLRGSLKSISVLDRLLLTHPVWLQLSINAAAALHVLQREPPRVRPGTQTRVPVLSPPTAFSLESSAISFPDLCRLIAFYCISRDVLPFTLELPEAISKATSHKQLESISHMGIGGHLPEAFIPLCTITIEQHSPYM